MTAFLSRHISFAIIIAAVVATSFRALSILEMGVPAQVATAILVIAATLWISEAIPLFVTAFVILALGQVWLLRELHHHGHEATEADLLAPFFSDVILLFLGGFVLSAALHKHRLDETIARAVLHRTGGRSSTLIFVTMAVTATLSMWLSNTATAAMMLAICQPVASELPSGHKARKALLLAVPYAANIGGLGTPIGSPPNAIAMQYMREAGTAPPFGTWLLIGIPGVMVMTVVGWMILMAVFRPQNVEFTLPEVRAKLPRSFAIVSIIGVSILTILGWVTSGMHGLSTGTVAMLPVIVFFGSGLLSASDFKSLPWDVLIMMGGGLCLGKLITISELDSWIVARLPVQGSDCFYLMLLLSFVACVMSSVMSNTATANLLMPVVLGLHVGNLSPILIGVAFSCTLAMPLPVSTPPNAIAFGTGELSVRDMLLPGTLITVAGRCSRRRPDTGGGTWSGSSEQRNPRKNRDADSRREEAARAWPATGSLRHNPSITCSSEFPKLIGNGGVPL